MEAEVDEENNAQYSFRDKLLTKNFGPYTGSQECELQLECPPMAENSCRGALIRNSYELQIMVCIDKKSFTITMEVAIYGFPLVNRIERDSLFDWNPEDCNKHEPLLCQISPEASEEVFFGKIKIEDAFSPTKTGKKDF
jgi:hypothetical protein